MSLERSALEIVPLGCGRLIAVDRLFRGTLTDAACIPAGGREVGRRAKGGRRGPVSQPPQRCRRAEPRGLTQYATAEGTTRAH